LRAFLLFALLHYFIRLCFSGLIFLVSHIPPGAVNMDPLLSALVAIETVLVGPRKALLWLWPWETTPTGFGVALTLSNSLIWGVALAVLRALWRRAVR
jgi:hypothetical protein